MTCCFPSCHVVLQGWDDPSVVEGMESYTDWEGINGLDVVGGASIFPHMDDSFKELVSGKSEAVKSLVCIRDEEVLCIRNQGISLVSAASNQDSGLITH